MRTLRALAGKADHYDQHPEFTLSQTVAPFAEDKFLERITAATPRPRALQTTKRCVQTIWRRRCRS